MSSMGAEILLLVVVAFQVMLSAEAFHLPPVETESDMLTPCEANGEFWNNSTGTCSKCKVCHNSQITRQKCSATSDTVCQCKSGWFSEDPTANQCRECRQCPLGATETASCSPTSNAQCSDCPKGKFRDDSTNSCQICSSCGPREMVLRPCGALFDTLCISSEVVQPELEKALRIKNHGRLRKDTEPADVSMAESFSSSGSGGSVGMTGAVPEKAIRASFWRMSDCSDEEQILFYLAPGFVIVVAVCYCTFRVVQESDCRMPWILRRSTGTNQQPLLPESSISAGSQHLINSPNATTPPSFLVSNLNDYTRIPVLNIQPAFTNFSLTNQSQPDPASRNVHPTTFSENSNYFAVNANLPRSSVIL